MLIEPTACPPASHTRRSPLALNHPGEVMDRRLLTDIAGYSANAEAKAYARETAQALGTGQSSGSAERVGGRPT